MNGYREWKKFSPRGQDISYYQFAKKMREEKERIEREPPTYAARSVPCFEKAGSKKIGTLSERDAIQLKVEAMLDAMTIIDSR
jgi:hypothetical protein